ncbi:hypothetical protein GMSM_45590 [Geomonas sp. Red276]
MKNPAVPKEPNADPGVFPFSDLSTKFSKESKNIRPLDIPRDGMGEDRFQRLEVFPFHPIFSTTCWYHGQG